ncbi:hypothetical protein H8356DRAFT_1336694 [Neocallimastix lanati (nom. inval.)]|nr:hypothetical protein H8356DRAFT_1336693 [Neocallimastix sp. JGI-2020a]KAG4088003.1 hypothetical protein H8356DRAFT_1336694 [Neocallimastix sp. JGI-2020a]
MPHTHKFDNNYYINFNSISNNISASRELGYQKSIPKKIVLENLSNNIKAVHTPKCCDYHNIPMS